MKQARWLLTLGLGMAAITPAAAVPACMHPTRVPTIQVDKYQVCWTAVRGASGYDAVLGASLAALGSTEATLAEANVSCLGTPRATTCVNVAFTPPVGDGFYFVVRANHGNAKGSYGTGCASERAGRDAELVVVESCP